MIELNLIFAVILAWMAKNAFDDGRDMHGWLGLIFSAANFALWLSYVLE